MKTLKLNYVSFWCLLVPVMVSFNSDLSMKPVSSTQKEFLTQSNAVIDQVCPSFTQWEYKLCLPAGDFHNYVKDAMVQDHITQINAANLGGNPDVCYDRDTGYIIFKSTAPGTRGKTWVSSTSIDIYSEC